GGRRRGAKLSHRRKSDRGRLQTGLISIVNQGDWFPRNPNFAVVAKPNDIDGLRIVGRTRVVVRDRPPNLGGAVPMAQREVVSGGVGKMRVADKPRRSGMAGEIGSGFVVAVSHGNLPTRSPGPDAFERKHVAVAEMRSPPDFEIEIWEQQCVRAGDAQDMQV